MERAIQGGSAIPQLGVDTQSNRFALVSGLLVAAILVCSTVFSHAYLNVKGPEIRAFLPICVTIWCFAELLTAFLLLSQFYVGGKISFAIIAGAYGVSGLTTIPYLLWFPKVFFDGHLSSGDLQVSAWLWVFWHLAFPILIAVAHLADATINTVSVPRSAIVKTIVGVGAGSFASALVISIAAHVFRAWLPQLLTTTGTFTPIYGKYVIPVVVAVNVIALGIVCYRARRPSTMQLWLAIALLTMTLDGIVNIWAPGRYAVVWYIGKFEAVGTSLTVLAMLLLEVATLYRRLFEVASLDTLTELPNRRSFNEAFQRVLDDTGERTHGFALLMIDVDNFKAYNDRYGHAAGDAALSKIAGAFRSSLRGDDFVARIGGEEFVILLPEVAEDKTAAVADRVRQRVRDLAIEHAGSPLACVTISIGVAYCRRGHFTSANALFEAADGALYAAKAAGRDRTIVRHFSPIREVAQAS